MDAVFLSLAILAVFTVSAWLHHLHSKAATKSAWDAVVALGEVAQAAHELYEIDTRTSVSMGHGSFANESNASVRRAKMRGYEVWRNSQITPAQNKLRAAYRRYENATRWLIEIVTLHPYVFAWRKFSERGAQWRERRRRRNTDNHPHVKYRGEETRRLSLKDARRTSTPTSPDSWRHDRDRSPHPDQQLRSGD
jgi:hypothetical protein